MKTNEYPKTLVIDHCYNKATFDQVTEKVRGWKLYAIAKDYNGAFDLIKYELDNGALMYPQGDFIMIDYR